MKKTVVADLVLEAEAIADIKETEDLRLEISAIFAADMDIGLLNVLKEMELELSLVNVLNVEKKVILLKDAIMIRNAKRKQILIFSSRSGSSSQSRRSSPSKSRSRSRSRSYDKCKHEKL